ncbi:MAG TPA: helix-turn-helix domain-containing protein [Myxococcota bacterium]|nr:helix-turn-helix domain-containing protein [Myxococcota bacterium]
MKSSSPKQADSQLRMISADELAAVLNLSVDSVYRLVRRGILPAFRVGRTVRFDLDKVAAALAVRTPEDMGGPDDK